MNLELNLTAVLQNSVDLDLLNRQLFLLPTGQVPKEVIKDLDPFGRLEEAKKREFSAIALTRLGLPDKVSVLMRSIGFINTCRILGDTPQETLRLAREMEAFRKEVQEITWNVVSAPQLNSFRVLQMLLFAELDTCAKYCANSSVVMEDGSLQKGEQNFQDSVQLLITIFKLMQEAKYSAIPDLHEGIEKAKKNLANFQTSFKGERAYVQESFAKIQKFLSFFSRAAKEPLHFLPILLDPVRAQASDDLFVLAHLEVSERMENWLILFQKSFEFQVDDFLIYLQKERKDQLRQQMKKWQILKGRVEDLKSSHASANRKVLELLRRWKEYQNLSPREQVEKRERLTRFEEEQSFLVVGLEEKYLAFKSAAEFFIKGEKSLEFHFDASLQSPFNYFRALMLYAHTSLREKGRVFRVTYEFFEAALPARYSCLKGVSALDLLVLQSNGTLGALSPPLQSELNVIFNEMQEFLHRKAARFTNSEMWLFANCAGKAENCKKMAQELLGKGQNVEKIVLFTKLLARILSSSEWPRLFLRSPFAEVKENPQLEHEFHCDYFSMLQKRIQAESINNLQAAHLFFQRARFHEGEVALVAQAKRVVEKSERFILSAIQKTTLQPLDPNHFVKEARRFFDTFLMAQEQVEGQIEGLVLKLSNLENVSGSMKLFETMYLSLLKNYLDVLVFIPGQTLLNYLNCQELLTEEADKKKIVVPEPIVEPPPVIVKAEIVPVIPEIKKEESPERLFQDFRRVVEAMEERRLYFNESEGAGYLANLLRNLQTVQELLTAHQKGIQRPAVILETFERVALLLEQSGKLCCSTLKLAVTHKGAHPFLEARGKECFWEAHAPLLFAKQVEQDYFKKQGKFLFTQNERKVMADLERTIAVTYRFPASEEELGESALWQHGLSAALKLVKCLLPDELELKNKSLSLSELESCFKPIELISAPKLHWPFQKLARLKRTFNYSSLSKSNLRCFGTIKASLSALGINLTICQDLMENRVDPSLILTSVEALFSRESAILEQTLLILLAHLPYEEEHFLWCSSDEWPKRYSHSLTAFSKQLRLALPQLDRSLHQRTGERAALLEPYLKQGHRYAFPCPHNGWLQRFATLSTLRQKMLLNQLSEQEAEFLERSLPKLDNYMCLQFDAVKGEMQQTLQIVDEWLAVFEEMVN